MNQTQIQTLTQQLQRLTVTKVVFEFKKRGKQTLYHGGLTVTKVVFEYVTETEDGIKPLINSNKGCF